MTHLPLRAPRWILALVMIIPLLLSSQPPAAASQSDYRLSYGDAVSVTIVGQPALSMAEQPVRPDGRISLPLVKEIAVAGKTVAEVTRLLNQAYHPYLSAPQVVVTIARFRPLRVTVLGHVRQPGTFNFQEAPNLLDVLAAAGGLTERGSRNGLKLVTPAGAVAHYDLDALLNGRQKPPLVQAGSVVEVAEVWGPDMYRTLPILASIVTAAALMLGARW